MKNWKLVAGVLLVFILGVLIGALGTGLYHQYLFDRLKKNPAERKAFILKKFSEKLDLTEAQKKAFQTVIEQVDDRRMAQIAKNRLEHQKIRDESYQQMKKILNPDQQNRFDELIVEIRRRPKRGSSANQP